ncbi:site-specific integrase [Salinimicrobium xinjiangense]|uniref:site-specific integrase n=1 Tax=Salinimicrobium xinjiangense TaxID=438596 RepID=UPI000406E055|nr:site-specific integrase [Salinimicrobium xinjiangense]
MVRTIFYIKTDKENNDGEHPIYCKIRFKSTTTTMSSGKWITRKRWQATNHLRNPLKVKKEMAVKAGLERIDEDVNSAYLKLCNKLEFITALDIKNKVTGKVKDINEVLCNEVIDLHNREFERKVQRRERTEASLQKYKRVKTLFENYIAKRFNKTQYFVKKIDNQLIYDFDAFLRYESGFKGKIGISNNAVVKYFQNLNTIFNYAQKRGMIEENPFRFYEGKIVVKDAEFLTSDELKAIENKTFSTERLNRVKDIFLFSCYTSYAPVDVENLTTDNLIKDSEGTLWLKTNRQKTTIKSNVPVLPPVKKIIKRYEGVAGKRLIPTISNQKINEYLKEIAYLCGIKKNLTHYVARHTFATTVTLGNGLSIENVSAMMGHTSINTTRHYAKVLDRNVKKDMEKLSNKLK